MRTLLSAPREQALTCSPYPACSHRAEPGSRAAKPARAARVPLTRASTGATRAAPGQPTRCLGEPFMRLGYRLGLSVVVSTILMCGSINAAANCSPCDKNTVVVRSKGVLLGLKKIPKNRMKALRKTILKDFKKRAKKKRGYKLTTKRIGSSGRVSVGETALDIVAARIELEMKNDASEIDGRDELWVFPGGRGKKRSAVILYGSPGISGSTGDAAFVKCKGGKTLCVVVWETCDGAQCLDAMRLIRIEASGKASEAIKLGAKDAKLISDGAEVSISSCSSKNFVCFKTTPMDPAEKPLSFHRVVNEKGFHP